MSPFESQRLGALAGVRVQGFLEPRLGEEGYEREVTFSRRPQQPVTSLSKPTARGDQLPGHGEALPFEADDRVEGGASPFIQCVRVETLLEQETHQFTVGSRTR